MNKAVPLALLSLVVVGAAQALVVNAIWKPLTPPSVFRMGLYHRTQHCGLLDERFCLSQHLMYLQCGAILVEKMAIEEDETPMWYAYSMHSGPKIPFALAAYYQPFHFDPSLPTPKRPYHRWLVISRHDGNLMPYTEMRSTSGATARDPHLATLPNQNLAMYVQETLDWLDSQDRTIVDACELRRFWYWKQPQIDADELRSRFPTVYGDLYEILSAM